MNRKVLIVILCVLAAAALLAVTIFVVAGVVRNSSGKINEIVAELKTNLNNVLETAKSDLAYAQAWTPPADTASDAILFPAIVAGYQYTGPAADGPHYLYQEIPGRFGVYSSASNRIIVSIYRVSQLEKEAIYNRMIAYIHKNGSSITTFGDATTYNFAYKFTLKKHAQYEAGSLWWSKGWLIFVRTENQIGVTELTPFVKQYLEAIKGG